MNFQARLDRVRAYLKEQGCEGLWVEDKVNLYYLTGQHLSAGKLIISLKDAFLLVDARYYELCAKKCSCHVVLADSTKNVMLDLLLNDCKEISVLGFDSENMSYQGYLDLKSQVEKIPSFLTGERALKPLPNPLKQLRAIKDKNEIELLRDASHLGSQGFDYVCTLLKEGISENEVALELEIFWKRLGSKGLAFEPIIAFGANSSMPHYRAGDAKLQFGDTVLIDIGVNYNHYHSDMTRVVFFGKAAPHMLEIYSIVKKAQKAALDLCRPGILIEELDHAARAVIEAAGYEKNFTHSLGHGVGLEIHEFPAVRKGSPSRLEEGMVITIEPGIYVPNLGGVRIEDTVVITHDGHENLTKRPVELVIIHH